MHLLLDIVLSCTYICTYMHIYVVICKSFRISLVLLPHINSLSSTNRGKDQEEKKDY